MPTVQRWINQLLDPDVEVGSPDPLPPSYYGQGQQTFGQQSFYQQSGGSSYPPAPDSPPPPLPGYGTSPAANNVAVTNLVTLALVNQTAAQKRTAILYQADQTGEAHQPTWTVRCIRGSFSFPARAGYSYPSSRWSREGRRGCEKPETRKRRGSPECMGGDGMGTS